MDSNNPKDEKNLLKEINQDLPKNIDWKEGARKYFNKLLRDDPNAERYHLIKPFIGGPDFTTFFEEMNKFLNMLKKINLPMNSYILDVGTGPGWTAYFLGKLGHKVLGIDISQDLLDLALKRIKGDPFPPYQNVPFEVEFRLHDIEERPIETDELFDVAVCDSTLHHFFNPISALKNISRCLKKSGIIVILEGAAPEKDSVWYHKFYELMNKYHTLERPYTKEQIAEILRLTGFDNYSFYHCVSGFFEQNEKGFQEIKNQIKLGENYNYVIASADKNTIRRINGRIPTTICLDEYRELKETKLFKLMKGVSHLIPESFKYKKIDKHVDYLRRQYIEILKRQPDKEGFDYYLSKLRNSELHQCDIITIFKNSEEYKKLK